MKQLRLFRPGGTQQRRVWLRHLDSAGVEIFAYWITRQEQAYLQEIGRLR